MKGKLAEAMRRREAQLSHADLLEILHYDQETGIFIRKVSTSTKIKVGQRADIPCGKGRRIIILKSKKFYAHRLAWFYIHGKWPEDQIDHKDLDPSNNRLDNLRESTQGQNMANLPRQNQTGMRGIYLQTQCPTPRWIARIRVEGKGVYIGCYDSPEKAHVAYCEAARKYYGEFARFE